MTIYRRGGKRLLDLAAAVAALPVLAVASAVVVPLIKVLDPGPAVYTSQRRGVDGKPFTMYKFRTMAVDAPDTRNADFSTVSSDADPRVTPLGRVLRKASLDEVPQILNVLRGDMSWIGPRPNMNSQPWESLSEIERKRVSVRPGITGLNQATRRNASTLQEKYELDCRYVDEVSLLFDLKIILLTVKTVLMRKNINVTSEAVPS